MSFRQRARITEGMLGAALLVALVCSSCGSWRNQDMTRGNQTTEPRAGDQCGDLACTGAETCTSCAGDCGACGSVNAARCGDNSCAGTENCRNCPEDCHSCATTCGNEVCDSGETCSSCPGDCQCNPDPSQCGDGTCSATEDCASCAMDCMACPPACTTSGTFFVEEMAIRDNASGQYIIGIKGHSSTGPVTASGIKLVNGTVVKNHPLVTTASGDYEAFVFLPGKPACTKLSDATTGMNNCVCNFPIIISNGTQSCTFTPVSNCTMCGARTPEDHDSDLGCTAPPPP